MRRAGESKVHSSYVVEQHVGNDFDAYTLREEHIHILLGSVTVNVHVHSAVLHLGAENIGKRFLVYRLRLHWT